MKRPPSPQRPRRVPSPYLGVAPVLPSPLPRGRDAASWPPGPLPGTPCAPLMLPVPVAPVAPRVPVSSASYSSRESLPSLFLSSSLKRVLSSAASFASSREMKPSRFLSRLSKRVALALDPVPGDAVLGGLALIHYNPALALGIFVLLISLILAGARCRGITSSKKFCSLAPVQS